MDHKFTFIALGAVFWVLGVLIMHAFAPMLMDGGWVQVLWYAANFAYVPFALILLAKATGRTKHDMLVPSVIILLTAQLMDGIAVSTDTLGLTTIYADSPLLAGQVGGFLLFAFWSVMAVALYWHRPSATAAAAR